MVGLCDKPFRVSFSKKIKHFKEIYNYSEFKKNSEFEKKIGIKNIYAIHSRLLQWLGFCAFWNDLLSCCPVSYRRCSKAFRRNWSYGEKINISLDFRVNWTLEHLYKGNINWISLFRTAKAHIFHSTDHIFFNHTIANYEDLLFRVLLILRCKTLNCKII